MHKHAERERMHELCSLAVLGEITPDDMLVLSAHLEVCRECQRLIKELDELATLDLSSAAAARIHNQQHHDIDPAHEAELLTRLVGTIDAKTSRLSPFTESQGPFVTVVPACPVPLSYRIKIMLRHIYPIAGWAASVALAAALILSLSRKQTIHIAPPVTIASNASNDSFLRTQVDAWRDRASESEKRSAAAYRDLEASKHEAQSAEQSLAEASARYQETLSEKHEIEAQLATQDAKLRQQASALNLAQASVEEERSDAATLRAQLQEVTEHLDRQRSEMARLQEVAATVPARMPAKVSDENLYDGREVFGARDLHIVDVYDVDQTGKASRTYGRVYYVNRSLLLFYAFDLDHNAKLRKPVAFQAWGFRQPNSSPAESLGLFYLEDPKIDRWTLRVSDPKLLARIDSLFVTVEPPGGSNAPRGRQLLFASLSGPPNHP